MRTKTAAVPIIIAIILSTIGLVYASWTDRVTIDGVVEMGSLTLAFGAKSGEPPTCLEFHKPGGVGDLIPVEYLDKDVGSARCWYSDDVNDTHSLKTGWKTLNIEVNNSYPCYYIFTKYSLHNIGTIPIEVYSFHITGEKVDSQTGYTVYNLLYEKVDATIGYLWEDVDGSGNITTGDIRVIWIEMTNHLPIQLDPCEDVRREVDIHFLQEAQQCHIYRIHITITGIQWNKLYEVETNG